MPLYEYNEGGRLVTRHASVAERDRWPGRVTVPRRVSVLAGSGRSEGQWQAEEVLRGFRREEQKDPRLNDTMRRGLGMTPDQIKDVWAQPDSDYAEAPAEVREAREENAA